MNLDKFVAVSGLSGVYKMAANRSNGLIVEDLDNGKRKFVSARRHQFTPLASIGIYTYEDTEELAVIFKTMKDKTETLPVVAHNAPPKEISAYFREILPEFDEDRVYVSDMKKVLKWFTFLSERNLLVETEPVEEEKIEAGTTSSSEEE